VKIGGKGRKKKRTVLKNEGDNGSKRERAVEGGLRRGEVEEKGKR